MLAIQNRLGTIQGLCAYRMEWQLGQGSLCSADALVALDLADPAAVAAALVRALEDLARRHGAAALRIRLPHAAPTTDRLISRLAERGHAWRRSG